MGMPRFFVGTPVPKKGNECSYKLLTRFHGQPYIRYKVLDGTVFLRTWLSVETLTTRFAAMIVGVGHDVFEVTRMEAELQREGPPFRDELFTPREIAYCEAKRYPARHFAARFAAKEAVFKALGEDVSRGQRWREVEIYNEGTGKPRVLLHGGTGDLARGRHIDAVLLSLSHTAELAAATVVLESRQADASTGER
jgi:holo-[acyl-carrier protein] synthase